MSSPVAGMCCVNCLYFEKTDEGFGECRRHAPQPNACSFIPKVSAVGRIHIDMHWPKVFNHSWCGQFGARRKVQKKPQEMPQKIVIEPRKKQTLDDVLKLRPLEPEKKEPPVVQVEIVE
jgi:hypothetical protein